MTTARLFSYPLIALCVSWLDSPESRSSKQHLENMQVRQAKINEGNVKWYVTTANGYAVSEGFVSRVEAEAELARLRQPEEEEEDE